MKDRATACVSWMALIVALVTFMMVAFGQEAKDAIDREEQKKQTRALERIAAAAERVGRKWGTN